MPGDKGLYKYIALVGENEVAAEIDRLGYLANISIEHHKIHEEKLYIVSDYQTGIPTAGQIWHIKPVAGFKPHVIFAVWANTTGRILFSRCTFSSDGTTLPANNYDENSSNTANTLFYYDSVVNALGQRIIIQGVGAGGNQKQGGDLRGFEEHILKPGTEYIIKYVPIANNANASINISFYEEAV